MAKAIKEIEIARDPVPTDLWGKDHWSTLAYAETRCVDHDGYPNLQHMRVDGDRHPGQAHRPKGSTKYPTRLKDGIILKDHDDYDCIEDAIKHGLIEDIGTGLNPRWKMTDKGRSVISRLRLHKANGGNFASFNPGTI